MSSSGKSAHNCSMVVVSVKPTLKTRRIDFFRSTLDGKKRTFGRFRPARLVRRPGRVSCGIQSDIASACEPRPLDRCRSEIDIDPFRSTCDEKCPTGASSISDNCAAFSDSNMHVFETKTNGTLVSISRLIANFAAGITLGPLVITPSTSKKQAKFFD